MNITTRRATTATLITLLALLALAGPVLAATRTVSIENFRFAPDPVRVSVGDTIRWRNDDPVPHTATARDGTFDTGLFLGGNTSDPIVLRTAGTFEYFCETHPEMVGRVIVAAATGTVPHTDTASPAGVPAAPGPLAVVLMVVASVMGALAAWRAAGRRQGDERKV